MRAIIAVAALAATLVACGKVGAPLPPGPPDKITFPKYYPTQ